MATNSSRIRLQAAPSRVWDALTKPELVKQWQYGSELLTDWQVGSEIRFRNEWEGKVFEQWGKVLVMEPFQLIRYSLFAPSPEREDKPENYFIMSYLLQEDGSNTVLTIEQQDNRPGSEAQGSSPEPEEDADNPILAALKAVAEVL